MKSLLTRINRAIQPLKLLPGNWLVLLAMLVSISVNLLLHLLGGFAVSLVLNALVIGGCVMYFLSESERVRRTVRQRILALQDLAYRDSLTGLPNRRFVTWVLEQNLAARAEGGLRVANVNRVLLFDLNGFKAVNDTYGHDAGDALLVFIARTLIAHLPADTILARLGGDEFVVLVRDTRGGRKTREVEATIRQAASSKLLHNGYSLQVSASVGVSSPSTSRTTPDDLLREADQRMYADKCASRNAAHRGELVTRSDESQHFASGLKVPSPDRRKFRAERVSEIAC